MARLTGRTSLDGLFHHHSPILSIAPPSNSNTSTSTDSIQTELAGQNADDLSGFSESSSFAEIKALFGKLAKETHPDIDQAPNDSSASQRFIQILSVYEAELLQLCDAMARPSYHSSTQHQRYRH